MAARRTTGLHTELTPELHAELVRVHKRDCDFMAATAVTCGVPPRLLDRWLRLGQAEDAREPYRTFALEFMQSETAVRSRFITELRMAKSQAQVSAITWLLQKRFRQFHKDHDGSGDALEISTAETPRANLSPEQKRAIIAKMLGAPTGPVRELLLEALGNPSDELAGLLARLGYTRTTPPEKTTDGTEETRIH